MFVQMISACILVVSSAVEVHSTSTLGQIGFVNSHYFSGLGRGSRIPQLLTKRLAEGRQIRFSYHNMVHVCANLRSFDDNDSRESFNFANYPIARQTGTAAQNSVTESESDFVKYIDNVPNSIMPYPVSYGRSPKAITPQRRSRRDIFQMMAKASLVLIPGILTTQGSSAATEKLTMPFKSILIIGCGFIGKNVAAKLKTLGVERISATTTSPQKVDSLLQLVDDVTVIPAAAEGDDAALHAAIAAHDAVFIAVGPGESAAPPSYDALYAGTAARVARALRTKSTPTHVGLISSCGVYGSYSHGELVNEDTPPLNPSADARALIAAEKLLTDARDASGGRVRLTILRPTGLWGGQDRDLFPMVSQVSQLRAPLPESMGAGYLSFAHVDDVVGAYVWCVSRGLEGPFNVASPGFTRRDFFDTLCDAYQLPEIAWKPAPAGRAARAPAADEGESTAVEADLRGGNKRVDCSRLLATGYRFEVPDTFRRVYDDQAAWRIAIINRRRKALGEALIDGLQGSPDRYQARLAAIAAARGAAP